MTESEARAIAHDAASRQMRKACREQWNEDDYNLACEKLARLMCHVNPALGAHLMKEMGLQ